MYKRLKNDFSFLNEYGFIFESKLKHYVQPGISFRKNNYSISVSFAYDDDQFYATFFDDNVRTYPNKAVLHITKLPKDGWATPVPILDGKIKLPGKTYEEQLPFARKAIIDFLNGQEIQKITKD